MELQARLFADLSESHLAQSAASVRARKPVATPAGDQACFLFSAYTQVCQLIQEEGPETPAFLTTVSRKNQKLRLATPPGMPIYGAAPRSGPSAAGLDCRPQ